MTGEEKRELENFKAFLVVHAGEWTDEEKKKLKKELKVLLNNKDNHTKG